MATFDTGGIAAELAKFDKLAKGTDEACRKAVKAGGKLLAQHLAEAAPRDTGALSKSIRAGTVEYTPEDGFHCRVAPVGENHGENLAKIGNILEYGLSNSDGSKRDGTAQPWFNPTIARVESEVKATMQTTFEKAQKG